MGRGAVASGAAAVVTSLLVAGCSAGPVSVRAPQLGAADARACSRLVDDLPDELAGQQRREVTDDSGHTAAWGDPAIVLTCGVGAPSGLNDTSTCVEVNRTGWYVPDEVFGDLMSGRDKTDVTTVELNHRPRVRVELPGAYRPDGFPNTTAALAPLIERDLRKVGRCR